MLPSRAALAELMEYAVEQNPIPLLKKALENPENDVNVYHPGGYTMLHLAVLHDWKEGVHYLLNHPDIQANLPEKNCGLTALHLAVVGRSERPFDATLLQILLSCPKIDVNAKGEFGGTALSFALHGNIALGFKRLDAIRPILSHPKFELDTSEAHRLLCRAAMLDKFSSLDALLSDPRIHRAFSEFSQAQIEDLWNATSSSNQSMIIRRILIYFFKKKLILIYPKFQKHCLQGL